MQVLNWLMFATIMILMMAYGPYGNTTAAALATLAIIALLGIAFVPRRPVSLSSSLREERETETKHRTSRKLVDTTENTMNQNQGDPRIGKMAEEAHDVCGEVVKTGIEFIVKRHQGNGPDCCFLGSMAALGALTPTAMVFAKRPKLSDEEIMESGQEVLLSLITEETLLFAALVAARIQTDLRPNGMTKTEFGPHILWQALSIWEKVYPDKKAEDHINNGVVAAARKFGEKTVIPFSEFMKKRANTPPSQALN